MSALDPSEQILATARQRLETVPTLTALVHHINVDMVLRDADDERFGALAYDATPTVRALFCRELAGLSWNGLYEYLSVEHRARRLGFNPTNFGPYNTAPTRQTLTTAWDVHLSEEAKRTLLSVSERLVVAADENEAALDLRPPQHIEETDSDLRDRHVGKFSEEQVRRHVQHARQTIFGAFDTGRAANTTYPDSRFDELQALMALGGCGTPQDQARIGRFFGEDYTPHGDTHLRTVKQYTPEAIQAGFEQSIENLLGAVNHLQILQPPVTVAIDITTWPYHAADDLPREVSGVDDTGAIAYKFATLSLVGKSMPIVLAVEPVIESSAWDENCNLSVSDVG